MPKVQGARLTPPSEQCNIPFHPIVKEMAGVLIMGNMGKMCNAPMQLHRRVTRLIRPPAKRLEALG